MIFMIVVRIDALYYRSLGNCCGSPSHPVLSHSLRPNSILRPYYTAVHIPAEKKEAEYTMWHLAKIVEADKHREPTEYELSLDNHSYYD